MAEHARDVKSIFLTAAETRSLQERAAYLDNACQGNDQLRQRIEELLRAHDSPRNPLDVAPPALAGVDRREFSEHPGMLIGRYKLLQEIGEGGFGIVYMAEQQEPVVRKVALKIIKLGMDTRQVVARFEAERQALAMMDHPNIAKVLDAGATDTGRPYFVMELVRGIPITEYCDKNNLTTRKRLELFVDVCHAVQHAHQKGIIHRDIKPNNVMVTLSDGNPMPKVIDFGIAKATKQRLTERTLYTDYHQFIGTPQYMSPEQATMSDGDVDTRTDVYSLGVLLYELLAGSPPFEQEQFQSVGYDEICRIIREHDPPAPSRRLNTLGDAATTELSQHRQIQLAALRRMLCGDLDWIVMKALEKDRTRRYDTANGFAADVERYLNNKAVEARHPSAAYTFRKFARRNRATLTTLSLVVGALLIGTVVSAWLAVNATIARRETDQARQRAEDLRYVSDMNRAEQALRDRDFRLVRRLLRAHHPSADGIDRRGWEWRFLWRACSDGDTAPTFRHKDWVSSIALSPDGATLVSGDMSGNLNVWDVATRTMRCSTKAHRNWVWDVALSADGKLASCGSDRFIRLWRIDPHTGRLVEEGTLDGQTRIWRVALSNDGKLLASSDRRRIRLWDLSTQEAVAQIPGGAVALAFHPETEALAAHLQDRVSIWRLPYDSNEPPWETPSNFDNNAWVGLAFSPDGQSIAASWRRNGVQLWSVAEKRLLLQLEIPTRAKSLAFSPNGTTIAIGDEEKTVSLWDTTSGKKLDELFGHSSSVLCVRFTRDGKRLASSSKDNTVRLWDLERDKPRDVLDHRSNGVDGLSFSADGKWLATADFSFGADTGQKVVLWDTNTWRKVKEWPGRTFAFSHDSKFLAVGGSTVNNGETIEATHVWDLHASQVVETMAWLQPLAFLPDGRLALRGGQQLKWWDPKEGKIVGEYTVPESSSELWRSMMGSAFSPDGTMLAVSTGPGDVALLDATTLNVLHHEPNALAFCGLIVVFSADGEYLLTPDGSHRLKVWNVHNRKLKLVEPLPDHTTATVCATFSPDGILAVGCGNGTVTFWDTATWTERATIKCHDRVLDAVCFSPDGSMMVTSGPEGQVRIHRAATAEAVIEAERLGVDPLTID